MTQRSHVRRVGLSSWLVEVDAGAVGPLRRYLDDQRGRGVLPGVVDVVAGACTVLLDGDPPGIGRGDLERLLRGFDPAGDTGPPAPPTARIPVRYDGADLADVARLTGLRTDDVVALHTARPMTVAFCGFMPGFAYIGGLPEVLHVPRLTEPRVAVPPGAVALAEGYTGIYPRTSPGGWRIVGHTDAELWNEHRDPPALLLPGTPVLFEPVAP